MARSSSEPRPPPSYCKHSTSCANVYLVRTSFVSLCVVSYHYPRFALASFSFIFIDTRVIVY